MLFSVSLFLAAGFDGALFTAGRDGADFTDPADDAPSDDDPASSGAAHAVADDNATADPTPNATANAPTRPT
jgi:hypothetical protein